MDHISSDTNVWIDFMIINRLALPFKLPYTYIMNKDAIEEELLSPSRLRDELIQCGLKGVTIQIEEFELANMYGQKYPRLSIFDRIALSIAKYRGIVLLTGDGALRKAAMDERVVVIGTIGILDQLYNGKYIDKNEYEFCLLELLKYNGQEVRVPKEELKIRLTRIR